MKVTNWEEVDKFVMGVLTDKSVRKGLKESDYEEVDSVVSTLATDEELVSKTVKKIMNLNILESSFKELEKMPRLWGIIYKAGMVIEGK